MDKLSPELLDDLELMQDPELPLHVQVRRGLTTLIDRYFDEGQPFWTETLLTERLNVSRITIRRALADLKSSGVLEGQVAKGTFVRKSRRNSVEAETTAFTTVGLVVACPDSPLITELLERLTELSRTQNLRIRTYFAHSEDSVTRICTRIEGSPTEERIILLGFPQPMMVTISQTLSNLGYRGVLVDMLCPDSPWSYVGSDNEIGMRLGLENLLSLGHKRIALLVNEPEEALTIQARIAAFERICHESSRQGSYPVIYCPHVDAQDEAEGAFERAYKNMPRLMETEPTAIFAVSDSGAWAALRYLAENGISVPNQISVIGFNDERPSRFTTPALTTVAHPMTEIVADALSLLKENAAARRFLAPRLVLRQSTAPPVP